MLHRAYKVIKDNAHGYVNIPVEYFDKNIFKKYGLYAEQGYAWSLALYSIDG